MKKFKLWSLLFSTMFLFAATAFVGCVDNNEDEGLPYLEVTPETLAFDESGQPVAAGVSQFVVKSNRPWTLVVEEKDKEWVRPSKTSGAGDDVVSFNIPASNQSRSAKVTFKVSNPYADYITKEVYVNQGDVVTPTLVFKETFGLGVFDAEGKPVNEPVASYTKWETTGSGASTVTFSGVNAQLRTSSASNANGALGSGGANVYFSAVPNDFIVKDITLPEGQTSFQLSFLSFIYQPTAAEQYTSTYVVELSADGEKWTKIPFTVNFDQTKYWNPCSVTFNLKENKGKLFVKLSAISGNNRIDDVTLDTSNGGLDVDLSGGGTPPDPIGDAIFYTNIGNKSIASPWPLVGVYDDWKSTGTGAANVTYAGVNTSVRSSGKASGGYEGASGPNVIFFGAAPASVMVNSIALTAAQTKLQLTFGASRSYSTGTYPDIVYDNVFDDTKFNVSLSANGADWTPVTYTRTDGDTKDPFWVQGTVNFTLAKSVSTIYVKFEATESSVFRVDDIRLTEGAGGQSVDLGGTAPGAISVTPKEVTLAAASGATATVNITSAAVAGWTAVVGGTGYTIDKQTGNGNATLTITASAANTTTSAKVLGTLTITDASGQATVAVSQAGMSNDILNENFGSTVEKVDAGGFMAWPYLDQFFGYSKGGSGYVEGTTTYTGSNVSVRQAGTLSPFSGGNSIWFPKSKADYMTISKLRMDGATNLQLSYTLYGSTSPITTEQAKVYQVAVSADGTTWKDLTYDVAAISGSEWLQTTANFTLKSAVEYLYLRFTVPVTNTTVDSRFDDLILKIGVGGQEIDLSGGTPSDDLTVAPASVTLAATSGATATFTVTTTTAWTATIGGSGYTINPASGTGTATVTVTASSDNTDSSVKKLGDVTVANTTVSKTVAVSQAAASTPPPAGTVVVDFGKGADIATPALPTEKVAGPTTASFVIDGLTYGVSVPDKGVYYWFENNYPDVPANPDGSRPRSLFLGKAGAYLELPAKSDGALTKVVLTSPIGASGNVNYSITDAAGVEIAGGASTNLPANSSITMNLTGTTANTAYRILVANANNGQLAKIELTYDDGGVVPTTPEITAVNPTSLSFEAAGGVKTVAVTVEHQGANALSVSGLSGGLSATVSGTTVTVTAAANMGAAINQTMTIALEGGNSKTVAITQAAVAATTPEITAVNPTSLSFEAAGGVKTVAVTVENQGANALSVSGLSGGLSATVSGTTVTVSGTTVTVTAAANTGAAINQTMTIALEGGNSKTVAITQAAAAQGESKTVTMVVVDVTGFNTTESATITTVTADGYEWTTFKGYVPDKKYLMMKGPSAAYLSTPAIASKTLKSITVTTASQASTGAQAKIVDEAGTEVSPQQTLNAQNTDFTFTLTDSEANKAYRIQAAGSKNAQFTKVVLNYE